MARVGQQHLPVGVHLVGEHVAKPGHRVGGRLEPIGVDIPRRQVALAVLHKAVSGEIHDHAIRGLGDRRQPLFQFAAQVGERRVSALQKVNILRRKRAAFVIDEDAIHRLGVTLWKLELLRGVKVSVLRDAHDQGVTARDAVANRRRLGRYEDQVAGRLGTERHRREEDE